MAEFGAFATLYWVRVKPDGRIRQPHNAIFGKYNNN